MHFDLDSLFDQPLDLSSLKEPFSNQEIDDVIKHLPLDKSPRLDGFNNDFLKKCWFLVKQDFYNLCSAFHSGYLPPKHQWLLYYSHPKG